MTEHDLVIIGGGPGGYIAAFRAAQLGLNVACIEKEPLLGGTCLRVGCIPSKSLLQSSELYAQTKEHLGEHGIQVGKVALDVSAMLKRKEQVLTTLAKGIDSLVAKHKVTRYKGLGQITARGRVVVQGEKKTQTELQAKHILIATGSRPAPLKGIEFNGERIGTSTEALAYGEVPKHLVVIGAGYIGLELGTVWRRLGSKVTVLEFLDRILPGTDAEIANEARKVFEKQGIEFRLKSRVTAARAEKRDCVVEVADAEPIRCDRVLVCVGRVPNTDGLGLDTVGVQQDARGCVVVNERYETSVPGIFAIGDVIGGAMLAHKAEDEGVACIEALVTGYGHVNYNAIPSVCYTDPELAAVGKTEEQLKEAGVNYRKGVFPFRANSRARVMNQVDGRVKVLADAQTDRVLGVHILGPRAGDLIAEATAAIEFGASSEDIARVCHAHPTLSEALKEAALAVDGRPLNM